MLFSTLIVEWVFFQRSERTHQRTEFREVLIYQSLGRRTDRDQISITSSGSYLQRALSNCTETIKEVLSRIWRSSSTWRKLGSSMSFYEIVSKGGGGGAVRCKTASNPRRQSSFTRLYKGVAPPRRNWAASPSFDNIEKWISSFRTTVCFNETPPPESLCLFVMTSHDTKTLWKNLGIEWY